MFSFAHPQYLYLLLLLPVIAGLFWLSRVARARKIARFGREDVVAQLMPDTSSAKLWLRLALELLLVTALVLVLARPRAGSSSTTTKVHGIEVMVAMDVSNSMNANSTDNERDVSRLQRAKMILEKLIDRLKGNKVGLVVFAGNAYMQMPITSDVGGAKLFLNNINTNMVPTQGTAIGAAINMSMEAFSANPKVQKAIIVITDGENFEDDAVEAARHAHDAGVQVDVMGVGSPQGSQIPMPDGGYLTDDNGAPVVTKLDEKTAQQIADAGKGTYVNGNASDALETLQETLDKLAKSDLAMVKYSQQDEQFPVFTCLAILFLIATLFVMERKSGWLSKYNIFSKENRIKIHHDEKA